MLLEAECYKKILIESPFKTKKQHCFTYLLDYNNPSNQNIINSLLHKDIELLTAKVERNILKNFSIPKIALKNGYLLFTIVI